MALTIVISMAGTGERFRRAGYAVPKYQIEAKGKTLMAWSLDSLRDFGSLDPSYIFIVRRADDARAFIEGLTSQMGIEKARVIELEAPTDGQATTVMMAEGAWDEGAPLLIYNIDTYVEPGAMRASSLRGDGFLYCFEAPGEHWSFARADEGGRVREVREKKRISGHASLGAYYFGSAALYASVYRRYYGEGGHLEKGERYIAPMYNQLIEDGGEVWLEDVDARRVHVLGTPEELAAYRQSR